MFAVVVLPHIGTWAINKLVEAAYPIELPVLLPLALKFPEEISSKSQLVKCDRIRVHRIAGLQGHISHAPNIIVLNAYVPLRAYFTLTSAVSPINWTLCCWLINKARLHFTLKTPKKPFLQQTLKIPCSINAHKSMGGTHI